MNIKQTIATMFSNPSWTLSRAKAFPNTHGLLNHDGIAIGVDAVIRGRGQDFALSVAGLEYLLKANQEGRVKDSYVALWQQPANRGQPELIAAEKAEVVYERLRNYAPREGQFGWGPYWWITADFMPAATMALSPDAPF